MKFDTDNIKLIKLSNGDTILGYMHPPVVKEGYIKIERPFRVLSAYDPEDGTSSVFITNWLELADNTVVGIPNNKVITIAKANPTGVEYFIQAFTTKTETETENHAPYLRVISNNDNPMPTDTPDPDLVLHTFINDDPEDT